MKTLRRTIWIASILNGVLFAQLVALMCRHGAEIANIDSIHYLQFSQTGCWGDIPAHYGIGYSMFLRMVSWLGGSMSQTTAWGNILLGFLFAAVLTQCFLDGFRWIGFLGICAILANYAILEDYARALSEGLFLVGLALGTDSLLRWRDSHRLKWLWISGLAMGMACLTRYAGLPFAFCSALCLWRHEGGGKRGWLLGGTYLGLSLGGMAVVALAHRIGSGTATNRVLDFHWAGINQLGDTASTIASWFMPDRLWLALPALPWAMLVAILILCAWGCVHGWMAYNLRRMLWSLSVPAYLLFLFFSYSLFDADIPFDRRMLSPIMPFLVFGLMDVFSEFRGKKVWICWLAMTGLFVFGIIRARPMVVQRFREGAGWNSLTWERSPTLQAIMKASTHVKIYSNASSLLSWRGLENVEGIVFWQLPTTEMDNPDFENAYHQMLDDLQDSRACLAHLQLCGWMKRTVSLERIVADAGLEKLVEFEDGTIWGNPGVLE